MADETIETVKIAAEEQGQRLDRVLAASRRCRAHASKR
jgi:hypothetical protein